MHSMIITTGRLGFQRHISWSCFRDKTTTWRLFRIYDTIFTDINLYDALSDSNANTSNDQANECAKYFSRYDKIRLCITEHISLTKYRMSISYQCKEAAKHMCYYLYMYVGLPLNHFKAAEWEI